MKRITEWYDASGLEYAKDIVDNFYKRRPKWASNSSHSLPFATTELTSLTTHGTSFSLLLYHRAHSS